MSSRLVELAGLFLKLGTIGFGGPAVHIATMEEETVERRGWMSRQQFLDLVGATNLIPGPNSTEMAMHVGYLRAGAAGLVVAGACFILPAVTITTALAWAYVRYGTLWWVVPLLFGIKPAVMAVILSAGWKLGRKALTDGRTITIGVAVAATPTVAPIIAGWFAIDLRVSEFTALLIGAAMGTLWIYLAKSRSDNGSGPTVTGATALVLSGSTRRLGFGWLLGASGSATAIGSLKLLQLGLFFLKVGAVLYGSGYVLIAYLEGGLVDDLGWLTRQELLDAVAIGQFTPGPILSTATFIGYLVMHEPGNESMALAGALVASAAIFLPSFLFVAILNPIIPKLRKARITSAFLDAINAASIGLMAAVTLKLAFDVLLRSPEMTQTGGAIELQWRSLLIAVVAVFVYFRYKPSPAWLVLGGALAGWALSLV
jgi:chromate transporter